MIRQPIRAFAILWTFTRYGLFWGLYRDVWRHHLTNPHCGCREDEKVSRRARRLRSALETLGPAFIKLGQFLSRRPDLLPPLYLSELAGLQDATPALPFETVQRRLEEVCICGQQVGGHEPRPSCLHCRGIAGVFDAFEPEPVASASLAQVHRAIYRGRPVALKLLKPGVLDRLNDDLDLLWQFRWVIGRVLGVGRNMPVREFLSEFRRRLLEEVNFEYEALNLERFRDSHPDDGPVRAPAVFWDFERADVLVLEFVQGTSLRTWHGDTEERRRLAEVIGEDFIRQVFVDNFFHADPHPGNVFVQADGRVVYLDFGTVGQLEPASRRAVLRLFRSIIREDPDAAVEAVLDVGKTPRASVDLDELRADIDRIIQLYRRRAGSRWSDAVVQTARRHGVRLPRSILLYAKATMLNEALVTELDPGFQVLLVARGMLVPIIEKEAAELAGRVGRELPDVVAEYASALRELPEILRRLSAPAAERAAPNAKR